MIRNVCLSVVLLTVSSVSHADVVTDWNATFRAVAQADGLQPVNKANPGWSTRTMAMYNGAIYDVFQAINRTHSPFLVDTQAIPGASREAAAHQAAYEILAHCYPGEAAMIVADFNSRMNGIADGDAKTNGAALGSQVAQAYIANRANDHADESIPYNITNATGHWSPDPLNPGQVAWGPGWGAVTPFSITSTGEYISQVPPVPALNSQPYTAAYNQLLEYGGLVSAQRTAEQVEIGLFWAYDRPAMGPPPILFIRNLEEIAEQAGNSPDQNARMFAMASVAMADAAIAAWDAKFAYDLWRPITAIRAGGVGGPGDADGNPDTIGDAGWIPLGAPGNDPNGSWDDFTPPFPAWPSGHATMGGALYKSLELFYGTNVFDEIDGVIGDDPLYSLTSQEDGSGTSRDFSTFTQVAPLTVGTEDSPEGENAISRIYLGIHWLFDATDGVAMGNDIAAFVATNQFQPIPEPTSLILATGGALGVVLLRRVGRRS